MRRYLVFSDDALRIGSSLPANIKTLLELDFSGRLEEFLAEHLGGDFEPARKIEGSTAELR